MKKRILIVEDEMSILQLLMVVLAKEGYEVHTCQNGREAISRMKQIHPHLVLLDVMLPGMDGKAVMSIMEHDEELNSIPVLVTSALVESEALFHPFPQVKGFCAKPFALKNLVFQVKTCLGDI